MRTSELKPGRTFAVVFEHGDDFMSSLAAFCRDNGIRQGYIPMFLAGFAEAGIGPSRPARSRALRHVRRVPICWRGRVCQTCRQFVPAFAGCGRRLSQVRWRGSGDGGLLAGLWIRVGIPVQSPAIASRVRDS